MHIKFRNVTLVPYVHIKVTHKISFHMDFQTLESSHTKNGASSITGKTLHSFKVKG